MQSYLFLPRKNQKTVDLLSEGINSGLESEHTAASRYLKSCPPSFLLELFAVNLNSPEKSKKVREFCEENNSAHVLAWAARLKSQFLIGDELLSLDKKESCSTLDQYLGAFYFKQFQDQRSSDSVKSLLSLQKSCELNFFSALVERSNMSGNSLKKEPISPDEWSATHTLLLRDLNQLGKFYRALGYLHSAVLLLNLGTHFANKRKKFSLADAASEEASAEDERLKLLAIQFYSQVAENFLSARHMLSNETSQVISGILCQNKDLASVFGFKNLSDAENHIKKLIHGYVDEASYQKIRDEVEGRISAALSAGGSKLRNSPRKA